MAGANALCRDCGFGQRRRLGDRGSRRDPIRRTPKLGDVMRDVPLLERDERRIQQRVDRQMIFAPDEPRRRVVDAA